MRHVHTKMEPPGTDTLKHIIKTIIIQKRKLITHIEQNK
jgi:hypothetical protein